MAISVGDAVLKITGDSADLDKALKDVDGKIKSSTESWGKNMKIAGAVMTGVGVAITGALVMSVKAAAEEQVGIEKLRVAMGNVGIAYDGAEGSLEKWINSTMKATAYSDDQQREALSTLIPLTGNLAKAQEYLGLAMDLARWKGMDLVSASELIGKVSAGNIGILARQGIIVEEGATAFEALAQIQKMAAGQAEAYGKTTSGQMEILKNSFDDVKESIGGALIPVLASLFKSILPVIDRVKAWMAENPALTKTIVIIVAALGGLMMVLGPLLMILPGLITALPLLGAAFTIATGPVGIIIAAIAALIAIGFLVAKNWDMISAKAKEVFSVLGDILLAPFRFYVRGMEAAINWLIGQINKISFTMPDWIPLIGGKRFGVNIPLISLPSFKDFEGIIPGIPGTPIPAMVHAGEYIGQGGGNTVNIYNPSVRSDQDITEITRQVTREMERMRQLRYG